MRILPLFGKVLYAFLIVNGIVMLWSLIFNNGQLPAWEVFLKAAVINLIYAVLWYLFFRGVYLKYILATPADQKHGMYHVLNNIAIIGCVYSLVILVTFIVRL